MCCHNDNANICTDDSKVHSQSTLLVRLSFLTFFSVGAIIFGVVADRFGRKPPYVICCLLFIILELATGFCNTYGQFIAVRCLYGVAMGG